MIHLQYYFSVKNMSERTVETATYVEQFKPKYMVTKQNKGTAITQFYDVKMIDSIKAFECICTKFKT